MEEKIIHIINQSPKQMWTPHSLSDELNLKAQDRPQLRKTLKKLAQEGRILQIRGKRYMSRLSKPTVSGNLKVHYEGYAFLIPDDKSEKDVFIPARHRRDALPDDHVLVEVERSGRNGKREGRVLKVLRRGRTHWIGRLEKKGRNFTVINQDTQDPLHIHVSPRKLAGAQDGEIVSVFVTLYPDGGQPMEGEIVEVLGQAGDEKTETASILIKHDIPTEFPKEVEEEAASLSDTIPQEEIDRRVDLRPLPIITIDGLKARDFDDAVCVLKQGSHYHLYVSIADVAHYIRRGSILDQEAQYRGTSAYFPDFAIPMLPEKLSNNLCSLRPGEDRLTLTCEMTFDKEGQLLDACYYESVIRSHKRGIYDDIQSYLDGNHFSEEAYSPEVRKSLLHMKELAETLMVQREKRGSINFDLPESEIIYDHDGKITSITQTSRFFSHKLIEEFMIIANVAVASFFELTRIPILYRVHDIPAEEKLEDFEFLARNLGVKVPRVGMRDPKDLAQFLDTIIDHPAEALLHQALLRCMRLAIYEPENRGHYGLNLKNYVHFTSPIRRYPDLIVHRQLKALLRMATEGKINVQFRKTKTGDPIPQRFVGVKVAGNKTSKMLYRFSELESLGKSCSKREREAMEAEREMRSLKQAYFMMNHVEEKFYGLIRRLTRFGMFVQLDPHFVDGLLHVSQMKDDYYEFDDRKMRMMGQRRKKLYQVGDRLWVRVKEVSIQERSIELSMAEEELKNEPKNEPKKLKGRKRR